MKKLLSIALILTMLLVLVSCSTEKAAEPAKPDETKAEQPAKEEPPVQEEEPEAEPEEDSEEESKSDPNTIKTPKYTYVITDHEVVDNGLFPDKKILAIHLTFTNNSDEAANVWMTQAFKAEQETDVTVELLMGANGQFPDDYYPELVKLGSDVDIKPGATVEAVIGYDMIDPESPVYLRPYVGKDFEIVLNE